MANILPIEKKIMATHMLCEGSSIRAIERMTGVHRDTIMRLGLRMDEGCKAIMNEKMRALPCEKIEVDEIWGWMMVARPITLLFSTSRPSSRHARPFKQQ